MDKWKVLDKLWTFSIVLALGFMIGLAAVKMSQKEKTPLTNPDLQELNEWAPSCFVLANCLGGNGSIEYVTKKAGIDQFNCKVFVEGRENRALFVTFRHIHTALSTCMLKMFRRKDGKGTPL